MIDAPEWTLKWLGMLGRSLGGVETFGIRRCLRDEIGYAEVINGVHVMRSHKATVIP